jgi:glycosyltransferase involved in cell wall biosynthesis
MSPDRLAILLLCYEYPPIGGGGGVGARQYAEAWVAKGHDVTVLTSHADGLARREQVNGVHVVRVPTWGKKDRATSTGLSMTAYLITGALHLLRHRSTYRRADILNTHFAVPTGPLGWFAGKLLRRPNVLTIIGGDIYDPTKTTSPHRHLAFRWLNSFLINAAARVIAISSDTRSRAERHYRVRRPISVVNYAFLPPEGRVSVAPLPSGRYHLISVGRLIDRKGFPYLIRALPLLPPDVHLLLLGDGPLDGQLRALADQLGVADRIAFLGYRSTEEIHGWLRRADCFVLSSLHEGLGIVVQEAMYAGLPVVATDEGGQVDLIRTGRNGLLVKPGSAEQLAAAIDRLYRDRELGRTMGANNRLDIEAYFAGPNSELYITAFRELIAERAAASTAPAHR